MPIDYSEYPPNWKTEIVPRIRERSGDKCEWCGIMNKAWVIRHPDLGDCYVTGPDDTHDHLRSIQIILTTAHIDITLPDGTVLSKHDKTHTDDRGLAHLCQKCHLNYDRDDHIRHRKENREAKLGIVRMDLP